MNGIRASTHRRPHAAAAAVLVALSLTGCPPAGLDTKDDPVGVDGVRCGTAALAPAVYIDVRYDATGMPSADPENCEVSKGATVTWRGPEGDDEAFAIDFKGASPVVRDERGGFVAESQGGRYKVVRQVGTTPGTYPYGIRANGKELDPAIIIR